MKIKNRTISSKEAPLIIAELGINHGGDLLVAEQMVKTAAERGCEVIKHQTHFLDAVSYTHLTLPTKRIV